MLRVATKQFPDPHLPTEDGSVIGLLAWTIVYYNNVRNEQLAHTRGFLSC